MIIYLEQIIFSEDSCVLIFLSRQVFDDFFLIGFYFGFAFFSSGFLITDNFK